MKFENIHDACLEKIQKLLHALSKVNGGPCLIVFEIMQKIVGIKM